MMLQHNRQHSNHRGFLAGRAFLSVAAGVALAVALAGCSGGDDSGTSGTTGTQTASSGAGTSGGAPGGMMSGGGGAPLSGPPPGMMGGMGGPPGAAGGQQVANVPPKNSTPPPGARPDPFKPFWSTAVPPPNVLTMIEPVRIAAANTAAEEKPAGVEIQEVPNRRVAGILTGNGVYALLDDFSGQAKVVKPGDVTEDGYRVASINANSVTLKRTVDNRTYTQVVPLTDAGSSSTTYSGPGAGMPGGPGAMMPGRLGPGVPGMPGRGKGGVGAD